MITTARVPQAATEGPTVEVQSLEGLVNIAIDTAERVLESPDWNVFRVLHDGTVYASTPGDGVTEAGEEPAEAATEEVDVAADGAFEE